MNASTHSFAETVSLRAKQVQDREFLFEVYASTRQEELAHVGWDAQQKEHFLRNQFEAQRHCYENDYPGAEFQVILVDGQPAGRLYVHERAHEIRIMDIALLPQFRGGGVGSRLLKEILDQGERTNRPVTIHVEVFNRAIQLYERLGFTKVALHGVYHLLQWTPARASQPPPEEE